MGHKGVPISTFTVSSTTAGRFEQVHKQMQKRLKHDILQSLGLKSLNGTKTCKTHDLVKSYIYIYTVLYNKNKTLHTSDLQNAATHHNQTKPA